jgi:hypothetical protein
MTVFLLSTASLAMQNCNLHWEGIPPSIACFGQGKRLALFGWTPLPSRHHGGRRRLQRGILDSWGGFIKGQ